MKAVIVPHSSKRIKMIAKANTNVQHFCATGGAHLNVLPAFETKKGKRISNSYSSQKGPIVFAKMLE